MQRGQTPEPVAVVQSSDAIDSSVAPARGSSPIVALGASAGGLAPTVELLRELGAEPCIAVLIIHHLDPTHESGLAEILSRANAITVCTEPTIAMTL